MIFDTAHLVQHILMLDMSIDILERLVEGPELDAVYELYPDDDDTLGVDSQIASKDRNMDIDDLEQDKFPEIITIDDDSD